MKKIVVWFRKDLRLHDNPALWEATQQGIVIPVFIWSKEEELEYQASDASLWWLHHSLLSFQKRFPLVIRNGNALDILSNLVEETKADAVFFNERYEPSIVRRDLDVVKQLKLQNIDVRTFNGNLLYSSKEMLNQKQEPYKVFTSFWKKSMQVTAHRPAPTPHAFEIYRESLESLETEELNLLTTIPRYNELTSYWEPGELCAINIWEQFQSGDLSIYDQMRDFPFKMVTSTLSPYLASGDISVRSIFYSARKNDSPSIHTFIKQLIWREFSYHQLIHFPSLAIKPLRSNFERFPWQNDVESFKQWTNGLTGYPLVDAGMRELLETGYMHNRVRMVAASFLVKHLLVDWRKGYEWFQQNLVDFDVANNAMGWQWIAGSGIDSTPYFRIFNSISQSEKFDPYGGYIRQWVPELSNLPAPYIHRPWEAPESLLEELDIRIGIKYPLPLVEHTWARLRAIESYNTIKGSKCGKARRQLPSHHSFSTFDPEGQGAGAGQILSNKAYTFLSVKKNRAKKSRYFQEE